MNFRDKAADLYNAVTPQGPLYGLPLPEGLWKVLPRSVTQWPLSVKHHMPIAVSVVDGYYYMAKDKIYKMIRGL